MHLDPRTRVLLLVLIFLKLWKQKRSLLKLSRIFIQWTLKNLLSLKAQSPGSSFFWPKPAPHPAYCCCCPGLGALHVPQAGAAHPALQTRPARQMIHSINPQTIHIQSACSWSQIVYSTLSMFGRNINCPEIRLRKMMNSYHGEFSNYPSPG